GTALVHAYSTVPDEVGTLIEAVDSVTGRCITDNVTIVEGQLNPHLPPTAPDGRPNRHSILATPLRFRERPIGALCVESATFDAYSESHQDALVKVAAQLSLALARVQSAMATEVMRRIDVLSFSDE